MRKHGKRYKNAKAKVEKPVYALSDAVRLLKELPAPKFDETVDAAFRLNVDPKQADQMVRGNVVLPKGIGKKITVAVIAGGEKVKEAEDAGADFAGSKDLIEKIKGGWMEFDALVATPDVMGELGKLGKILGPRGLMPSPKSGTVTFNVAGAVKELKAGKINYRVDKAGNIHAAIGKISFSAEDILANAETILQAILRDRPATVRGAYIRSFHLSTTMGPSVRIDLSGTEA